MVEKNKRSFLLKPKIKEKLEVKEISQAKMNMYFMGGFILVIVLAILSITAAFTRSIRSDNTKQAEVTKVQTEQVDNRLQLFLESYVTTYFTYSNEGESEYRDKVNQFYNFEPDVKQTGLLRPMTLVSYKLERITKDTAIYRVTYEIEGNKVTVLFGIPYTGENGQYLVTGLPYYEAVTDYKAEKIEKSTRLTLDGKDDVSEEERIMLSEFLQLFFKNYTTSQDNLNIISKDIKSINGAVFKSIDYTYFVIENKEEITAYVQVTFDILESSHSENFTFSISQKDDSSFFVNKMEHGIPSNYKEKQSENEGNKE
ncbi:conjugal transfer protein [Streptococcus suis]|nr:conjugal transfer protein [Streptococcus suis]